MMLLNALLAVSQATGGTPVSSVPDPTLNPPPAFYSDRPGALTITMACTFPGIKMRYTTSAVDPTLSTGTLINSTSGTTTCPQGDTIDLRVIAIDASNNISNVKRGVYTNIFDHG